MLLFSVFVSSLHIGQICPQQCKYIVYKYNLMERCRHLVVRKQTLKHKSNHTDTKHSGWLNLKK